MAASLNLVHHTSHRWRFKLDSSKKLDWIKLAADLDSAFPCSLWSLRLNSIASSIVITYKICGSHASKITTFMVRDRLVHELNKQSLSISEIPLSQTEVVEQVFNGTGLRFQNLSRMLFNALSMSISFSLLFFSLLLFLIGLFGLFLPLTPGFWVLMLATIIFDMAIALRRPFIQAI